MGAPMLLDDEVVGGLLRLAQRRQPVRRARDGDRHRVRRAGGDGGQRRASSCSSWRPGAPSSRRRSSELEALREVGEAVSSSLDVDNVLVDDRHARRRAVRDRRRLDHGVLRAGPLLPGPQRLPDRPGAWSSGCAPIRIDLDETLVGRAARERRPIAVHGPRRRRPRPAPADPARRRLALAGRRPDAARGPDRRRRWSSGASGPATSPRRPLDLLETFASQSALALLNAQLFRELKEQSVELELASRHKSEFLASMSHELRTPLNAVLGFSEVLLERMFGDINERQEEYLRDIHGSGKHLLELLNEILDLSKVEAGRMELEYSSFDLRPLLEDAAVHAPRARRRARHRPARRGRATTSARSYSDELRLKQVVLNLMTNAVKFTGDGGSVVVRAVRDGPRDRRSRSTDTGIGVPEADRERIFESFQQGGRGSSREEGTGLGLTLSRRIVELLGGRMWLESEVGVGSTFGFSLPAARPRDRSRTDGGETTSARRRGRRHRGRPAVAGPVDGLPVRRRAARSPRRGTASPVSRRCGGRGRTPCCSTSGCPASTAGRCSRRSRRTRRRATSR